MRFFHITHFKTILNKTLFSLFKDKSTTHSSDKHSISQFQTLSTALAATMGTGNIVGVATALTIGGPGAIFWMWISALFGMIIVYAENVLGSIYRFKNKYGQWLGGPMAYLEKGLNCKWLAVVYAVFCTLASFEWVIWHRQILFQKLFVQQLKCHHFQVD
jgi:AGCS family alanine or glycine:cation symporter